MESELSVSVDISDVMAGLDALEEHLEHPEAVMRKFAPGYRASVKATLAQGGIGSIPYAASTRARMEATGTSQVSARGTIRADRVKRTMGMLNRHAKKLDSEGWSPDWQAKQDQLTKRVAGYEKAEGRAERAEERRKKLKKDVTDKRSALSQSGAGAKEFYAWEKQQKKLDAANQRKIGKRKAELRTHPLQYMGGTVRSKISTEGESPVLTVYSRAGVIGKVQDEGGPVGNNAAVPKRAYIVTPDFEEQKARLGAMFATDLVEAFDGG